MTRVLLKTIKCRGEITTLQTTTVTEMEKLKKTFEKVIITTTKTTTTTILFAFIVVIITEGKRIRIHC